MPRRRTEQSNVVRMHLDDNATAGAGVALQRTAYAVEARLIGSDDIPQLHESLEELVAAKLGFYELDQQDRDAHGTPRGRV